MRVLQPRPQCLGCDANGITVKASDGAQYGFKGIINDVEYTVVDRWTLHDMIRFGEDVTKVCTSRIEDMELMFSNENSAIFNQDISSWDVSNVTNMRQMFSYTYFFNQDLSAWDVSNVTSMVGMFSYASSFNQDLSSWDVSNVTNMSGMFNESSFNQDLSTWDVSNVTTMESMFSMSSFNQDISAWDVSNVTSMVGMFQWAGSFNADISAWDVSNVAIWVLCLMMPPLSTKTSVLGM